MINGNVYLTTVVVDDPNVIAGLVNSGDAPLSWDGCMPKTVTIYNYCFPENLSNSQIDYITVYEEGETEILAVGDLKPIIKDMIIINKGPQLTKRGQEFIEEYWFCDGDTVTRTFNGSAVVEWTTSMTDSLEIGGAIVSVAELKRAVSTEIGLSIGVTVSYEQSITSTAPAGMKRCLRSWMNYTGFEYTASYENNQFAFGNAYRPCGMIILHCDYPYDPSDYFE